MLPSTSHHNQKKHSPTHTISNTPPYAITNARMQQTRSVQGSWLHEEALWNRSCSREQHSYSIPNTPSISALSPMLGCKQTRSAYKAGGCKKRRIDHSNTSAHIITIPNDESRTGLPSTMLGCSKQTSLQASAGSVVAESIAGSKGLNISDANRS